MGQKIRAANFFCFFLKYINEGRANDLALALRIRDALQLAKKEVTRIRMDERNIVVIAEKAHNFVRLACTHDAGINKHALQLVADRFMKVRK